MRTSRLMQLGFATAILAVAAGSHAAERQIPPAFGPYVNPSEADFSGSASFKTTDRIVGTYYFYWYDINSQSHILNHDGTDALTTHPATLKDFSYKSVAWHKQQLTDMDAAGIDLALMVF